MKLFLLNILLFIGSISSGIAQVWVPVEHEPSGLTVKMPKVPKYAPEDVYTLHGVAKKISYSTQFENVEMVFEIQELHENGKKAEKAAIGQMIKNTTTENHGNSPKTNKQKKGNLIYSYIETPLITGELIRSVVFVHNNYIIQIYVKGTIVNAFNESANDYLFSWTTRPIIINEDDSKVEIGKIKKNSLENTQNVWVNISIEPALEVQFPAQPFKKSTLIENGLNDFKIDSYAYTDRESGKTYIVSVRPYTIDQGQLTNSSIYNYYLDRIKANKKLKLNKEELIDRPNEGIEYVFSKGIRFYRLKLIRVNNVMYQFLIKGKRKKIYNEESEYFFNNFNILN